MNNQRLSNIGNLLKDFSYMGLANVIVFFITVLQSIIVPKLLGVSDFGYWRIFILYITFSGFLHLGFVDGIYMLGAREDRVRFSFKLFWALRTLLIIMLITSVLLSLLFIAFNKNVSLLFLVLLFAFGNNIFTLFQSVNQILQKYKIVSRINILFYLTFIIILLGLCFIRKINHYYIIGAYIIAMVFTTVFYFLILLRSYRQKNFGYGVINASPWPYIISGFPLLIANLFSLFLINSDMVMVSNFFSIDNFAYYAFAGMLLNIILLLTRALSAVFFPYVSTMSEENKKIIYKKSTNAIIIAGGLLMGLYPIAISLIKYFLPKYLISIQYLRILMVSPIMLMCIQVIQTNYYQLFLKQNIYMIVVFVLSIVAASALFLTGKTTQNLSTIAYIKVFIMFVWFVANEITLYKTISQNLQEIIKRIFIVCLIIAVFLWSMHLKNIFYGLLIYFSSFISICLIFFKSDVARLTGILVHSKVVLRN